MPHNETRLWVGLAIAAIAIPAVGTFYRRSTSSEVPASTLVSASNPSTVGLGHPAYDSDSVPVARTASRDYVAEVRSAAGDPNADPEEQAADLAALDDEMFDLSPFDEPEEAPVVIVRDAPPDPATMMLPNPGETVAYSIDGPVAGNDAVEDREPATDAVGQPILTDTVVFRTVVNNLNEDERDEFVRAYAAMTPAQRADLLDGFRNQMQDDGAQ